MNTLETYEKLKEMQFSEEQSKGLARLFGKYSELEPASKRDLSETELRLQKEIEGIRQETQEIRLEIKELDIRGREADSRIIQTISESKGEILKWVAGMLIANTGLIVALSKLLK